MPGPPRLLASEPGPSHKYTYNRSKQPPTNTSWCSHCTLGVMGPWVLSTLYHLPAQRSWEAGWPVHASVSSSPVWPITIYLRGIEGIYGTRHLVRLQFEAICRNRVSCSLGDKIVKGRGFWYGRWPGGMWSTRKSIIAWTVVALGCCFRKTGKRLLSSESRQVLRIVRMHDHWPLPWTSLTKYHCSMTEQLSLRQAHLLVGGPHVV